MRYLLAGTSCANVTVFVCAVTIGGPLTFLLAAITIIGGLVGAVKVGLELGAVKLELDHEARHQLPVARDARSWPYSAR